jgi:hypothetical protein
LETLVGAFEAENNEEFKTNRVFILIKAGRDHQSPLLFCARYWMDDISLPFFNFPTRNSRKRNSQREREPEMTDEELDRIIQLLLADPSAGLKAYAALTLEHRKQVLERAQDERINQIVAEADAESITD